MNRASLALLCLPLLTINCAHKRIVLPDNGDRTIVYTESGDTLTIKNKTITLSHPGPVPNVQYQGELGLNKNYAGKFETSKEKEVVWTRDGLSNVLIQDSIMYYTNHGKVQRYDLKNNKALEALPITIQKPVILSLQNNLLSLVMDEGTVRVYDVNAKKIILEQTINELITKRPLIDKGHLFVQSQSDELICFDIVSNKELWRYTHSKHHTYLFQQDRFSGLATWGNHIVFVSASGDIVVLDKDTQEPYWIYPSTSMTELMLNSPFTPIVHEDKLYLAKKDTGLMCLDLKERNLVWNRPSIQTFLAPCIYGGYIFVACGKTIVAVNAKTGEAAYQTKPLSEAIVSTPFIQEGKLVTSGPSKIYRLSPESGEVISEITSPKLFLQSVVPFQNKLALIWADRVVMR